MSAGASPVDAQTARDEPKLVVHHLNNSRSQRILWLLEELEIPYEIKKYQRTSEMLAPPELKSVHPLGNAPVITDGELTLAESGAIVEYIIQKYGNGRAQPPDAGKIDNLYYTHYAEASLMPMLVNKLIFTIIPERSPFFLRPLLKGVFNTVSAKMLNPRLKAHAEMIESHLSKTDGFFAGGEQPTSADYMMIFCLETWVTRDGGVLGPKTKAYIEKIHSRPAYQRGLEKGGEYTCAKVQTTS
ncbi:thioredoxin-like protein [Trametes sanguinea]|nr:thioredoxin-like protein [Trametes sanguinea]